MAEEHEQEKQMERQLLEVFKHAEVINRTEKTLELLNGKRGYQGEKGIVDALRDAKKQAYDSLAQHFRNADIQDKTLEIINRVSSMVSLEKHQSKYTVGDVFEGGYMQFYEVFSFVDFTNKYNDDARFVIRITGHQDTYYEILKEEEFDDLLKRAEATRYEENNKDKNENEN